MVFGIFKKMFDENAKVIARLQKIVDQVNSFSDEMESLDDSALRAKTEEFKGRLANGETLDDILPEAFAVCREADDRRCYPGGQWTVFYWEPEEIKEKIKDAELADTIRAVKKRMSEGEKAQDIMLPAEFYKRLRALDVKGLRMRPFDVQVMGGVVHHEGNISEMKTGEGKTLVATMPVYLNALSGDGVHVVTVNDYLAKRDAGWMEPVYRSLGLTVGVVQHSLDPPQRRVAYGCDITYGTNNEFGFDYLRDNMAMRREYMVQRGHNFAIVDEVDNILIDEARTPLIISGPVDQDISIYYKVNSVMRRAVQKQEYFEFDEKDHTSNLTEAGQEFVARAMGIPDLFQLEDTFDFETGKQKNVDKKEKCQEIVGIVQSSLKAYTLFKKDKDYIVKDGQVIIVDEFTGRLMHGRRYSEGLHQAIEAKESTEGARIQSESQTIASITFQNYFRLYKKLAGMTGTAKTEESEFSKIYGLDVIVVPTNKPMVRVDNADVVYRNEEAKFKAIVEDVAECHKRGQPVLVGTVSVEKSERLSRQFLKRGIPHSVLNAKHHEREAEIVANAGRRAQVTIATNMAGRGTDIKLGDEVPALGGLYIIGSERHEARRIDNQLRGRSGRQGDPGASRFYLSLEDDLMRLFGSDRVKGLIDRVGFDDSEPLEHPWLSRAIEGAQKKIESMHFETRKHVLEYDDVMNKQRETVYEMRRAVLFGNDDEIREKSSMFLEGHVESLIKKHCNPDVESKDWDIKALLYELAVTCYPYYEIRVRPSDLAGKNSEQIRDIAVDLFNGFYSDKEKNMGADAMRELERIVILVTIDNRWKDHLYQMDRLKEGIGLRAYGQVNPIVAYQKEAFELFDEFKDDIRRTVARGVLTGMLKSQRRRPVNLAAVKQEAARMEQEASSASGGDAPEQNSTSASADSKPRAAAQQPLSKKKKSKNKLGVNDPCPCGSGKKYKHCCMNN